MAIDTECLIVGASAAGLATAASLQQAGRAFEILEATDVVGNAWRHHYDRLHLHTSKSSSVLPGLKMPREWPRYAARNQVVDYLERYRDHHGLAPHYGQPVTRLERRDDAWVATTSDREWRAGSVVVATGIARCPVRPTWPGMDSYGGGHPPPRGEPHRGAGGGGPPLVVGFWDSPLGRGGGPLRADAEKAPFLPP